MVNIANNSLYHCNDMRPAYHHKEERAEGHLFISVLAYQAFQAILRKLKGSVIKAVGPPCVKYFQGSNG